MMANSTTAAEAIRQCQTELWYSFIPHVMFAAYNIITPCCCVFGLISHALCLSAYHKQSKKEPAYLQQIFVTIGETISILSNTAWVAITDWIWQYGNGPEWFTTCYTCIWYIGHLASPLQNVCLTTTLLLTLSMAADRLLAISKPNFYLNRWGRRQHFMCASICVFLGIATSLFDGFQTAITEIDGGQYTVIRAPSMSTVWMMALAQFRGALRIAATLSVIICNVVLIHRFRVRGKKVAQMTALEPVKEIKRKETEKTLLILAVSESFFISMSMLIHSTYYVMLYVSVPFSRCEGRIMAPITDAALIISDTVTIYITLALRPSFRRMMLGSMPCFRLSKTGQNTPQNA